MFCREFTTPSSCNQNWVTHPCNWHNNAYRTESCSEFTSSNSCTSNAGCSWQPSGQQIQDRTVVCKDNNGNVVADSFCGYPKPATTQNGTTESCTNNSSCTINTIATPQSPIRCRFQWTT